MSLTSASDTMLHASACGGGQFENTYARLPERFYVRLAPIPVRSPRLVKFNPALAGELGLDAQQWESEMGTVVLSGNHVPGMQVGFIHGVMSTDNMTMLSTPFDLRA